MGFLGNSMFSSNASTPVRVKVSRYAPISTNLLIDRMERIGYQLQRGEDVTTDWGYLYFEGPWGKHTDAQMIIAEMMKAFPNQISLE